MKKLKAILFAAVAMSCAGMQATTVTEDFESVQVVDASGNVVTGNYTAGVGLDNGWLVVGGGICKSADYSNFGLWSTAYNGSKVSLTAQYGSSNSAVVVIPVQVSGEISFYARKTSSSSSTKGTVDIYEMVEDNGSFKKKSTISLKNWSLTTTWTQYTFDLGEDARYIGISMVRAGMDNVVYNAAEAVDGPVLQVLQEGKAVSKGATVDLGLVEGTATSTFTVKNNGTGTLNATVACTGDYSTSVTSVSLGEGETQNVTVTQSNAFGSHTGTLAVTVEEQETFTINLAGIVRDPAKLYNDFSEAVEGWTVESNWSIADGSVAIGYPSGTPRIITPMVKTSADDELYIKYKKNTTSTYSSAYFRVWTSEDGHNWTKVGTDQGSDADYNTWKAVTITGFPANAKYISITGQYMALDDFYGFAPYNGATMSLGLPAGATEDESGLVVTDNFGFCKVNATHTYTVTNAGNATLNVDIASSNDDFTVAPATLEVAAGESATFDLTFVFSEDYGSKNAAITLQPQQEEVDAVTINANAIAQDPETFEEDFENGMPETWTNNGWEIISNPTYGNGTKMAYAGRYADGNTLITPRLIAKANETIELQALLPWNDESLTMEYTTDDGENWTVAFSETPANNNTLCTLHWNAPADGIYQLRFSGRYNYIDNIRGFKYAPEVVPAWDVTFADTQFAPFCYPTDVTLVEGVLAVKVTDIKDDLMTVTEVANGGGENGWEKLPVVDNKVVPANTPVILFSLNCVPQPIPAVEIPYQPAGAMRAVAAQDLVREDGNYLVGYMGKNPLNLAADNEYVFDTAPEFATFEKTSNEKPGTVQRFGCYIELNDSDIQTLRFDDGNVTSINNVEVDNIRVYKTIENGQVIIVKGNTRYDIMGHQVK